MPDLNNEMPHWMADWKREDPEGFSDTLRAQIRETEIALLLIRETGHEPLMNIPGWVEMAKGECGIILDRLFEHPDWSNEQIATDILAACAVNAAGGK